MATIQIPNLGAAISLSGSEELEIVQSGVSRRATVLQIASFATGIPSGGLTGQIFIGNTGSVPSWSSNPTISGSLSVGSNVGIGTAVLTGNSLRVSKNITGGTFAFGVTSDGIVQNDVTNIAYGYHSQLSTAAATFTVNEIRSFSASQGTIGAGTTVNNQLGYNSSGNIIAATNNYGFFAGDSSAVTAGKTAYGFYSAVNIASGGGTTFGFYAFGNAPNRFSGDVTIFGAGGLGYSTGSGGTVTQTISRTTGVTINKTNGAITMFTAAGSATAATFTVTNSTVAATDTVVVSVRSGTNVYLTKVTAVAAGSFNITFFTTGGTASDAPVINFAVIKAVTA